MSNSHRALSAVSVSMLALIAAAPAIAQDADPTPVEITDDLTDVTFDTATADEGAPADLTLVSGGSITLDDPALAPAITLNSDNIFTNAGAISIAPADGGVAVLLEAGGARSFIQETTGTIILDPETAEDDEEEDPPLAFDRRGVLLSGGAGAFEGDILLEGVVAVAGDRSFGVLLDEDVDGSITTQSGTIFLTGDDGAGFAVNGDVSGDAVFDGNLNVFGERTSALSVAGDVTGRFTVGGVIDIRAYTTLAPEDDDDDDSDTALDDEIDEQVLLQPGPAVAVSGSLGRGFLLNGPRAQDVDDDDDGDGNFFDEGEASTVAAIRGLGSAPGILISPSATGGPSTGVITLGTVGVDPGAPPGPPPIDPDIPDDQLTEEELEQRREFEAEVLEFESLQRDAETDAFGLILRGAVEMDGVFRGVSAQGVVVDGENGSVDIAGGVLVENRIAVRAVDADATAFRIGRGVTAPEIDLIDFGVEVSAEIVPENLNDARSPASLEANGILIEAGASVQTVRNGGFLLSAARGDTFDADVSATAFNDQSGSVTSFTNNGSLIASNFSSIGVTQRAVFITDEDTGDVFVAAGGDGDTATSDLIAADFSANTTGVTFRNEFAGGLGLRGASINNARILGDLRFGSGDDAFLMENGNVVGDISFGAGDDVFELAPPVPFSPEDFTAAQIGLYSGVVDFGAGTGSFRITQGAFFGAFQSSGPVDYVFEGGEVQIQNFDLFDEDGSGDLGVVSARNIVFGGTDPVLDPDGVEISATPTPIIDIIYDGDRMAGDRAIRFDASGSATINEGVTFRPLLTGAFPENETIAIVTAGDIDLQADPSTLLRDVPFILNASTELVEGAEDVLLLNLDLKEADEVGLDENQNIAFEPVLEAVQTDDEVSDAFSSLLSEDPFVDAFNSFLPNYTDADITLATETAEGARSAIAGRASAADRETPNGWSAWADEFTMVVLRKDDGEQQGFSGGGFGFAFGADKPIGPLDAAGIMILFSAPSYDLKSAANTEIDQSTFGFGGYVAEQIGAFSLDADVQYGFTDYNARRVIAVDDSDGVTFVRRLANASWSGNYLSGGMRASWQRGFGREYFVRPEAAFSYVSLSQDGYTETGLPENEDGSANGLTLTVSGRDDASARLLVETSVGRRRANRYGHMDIVGRIGVRQEFITDPAEAEVSFAGADDIFTLTGAERSSTALRGGAGVSFVSGAFSQVELSYDAEVADGETRHQFRFSGRIRF